MDGVAVLYPQFAALRLEREAEGHRCLLPQQLTGLLVRHIFGVTFHFSFSLKMCSHFIGRSHFIVLNPPTALLCGWLGFQMSLPSSVS